MPNDELPLSAASPSDPASLHEAAYSFAEEFARMGHDGPKILRMFQNPFYVGAYGAYRVLGHTATAAIIDQCLAGTDRARVYGQTVGSAAPPASAPTKKGLDRVG